VKALERQIELKSAALGAIAPLITAVTISILLIKGTSGSNQIFPWVALIGLGLCWQWRVKGLACAIGILCAVFAYQFSNIPVDDRLWYVVFTLSLCVTFGVAALTFDEISTMAVGIATATEESDKKIDQKESLLRAIEHRFIEQTSVLNSQVIELQQQIKELQDKSSSYQEIIDVARNEVAQANHRQESLQKELTQASQQVSNLESEVRMQLFELEQAKQEAESHKIELQEKETLCGELKEALKVAESKVVTILPERSLETEEIPAEIRRLEGLNKQLREQFEEKTEVLAQTRRELFVCTEKLACAQKEMEEKEWDLVQEHQEAMQQLLDQCEKELTQQQF